MTTSTPKYPNVKVQLTGEDGNSFAIIGSIQKAIRREVGREESNEWSAAAMKSPSYDALLTLAMEWVDVG